MENTEVIKALWGVYRHASSISLDDVREFVEIHPVTVEQWRCGDEKSLFDAADDYFGVDSGTDGFYLGS